MVINRCSCHLDTMSVIVCFTWLLLVCHEAEPAVTAFGSLKPSNPTIVREGNNITLKWNYTIDGSIGQAQFFNATDDVAIAAKFGDGDATVASGYQERFKADISNTLAQLTILTVQSSDSGCYRLTLTSTKVVAISDEVELKVQSEASITRDSGNQTKREGLSITLFCDTSGNPEPNVTWTMENGNDSEEVSFVSPWVIKNINRTNSGTYRCTARNGIGSPVSRLVYVDVTYPAKIVKLVSEHEVAVQQSASLECQAEGNPQPTYTWTPCNPQQSVCHESTLIIPKVLKDTNYSCRVENSLDSDAANTSVFIASDVINVTLVITSEDCADEEYNQLWEKLNKTINEILSGKLGYESVQQKDIRCGSVIVDLTLKFNSTVRESDVLSILRKAAKDGKFGDINFSAITGTRYTEIETTMATTPTGSPDSTTWIIVGVVVGVVVVLAVVGGGVAWYVYKKRKCKKRVSKVHNNGSQGEAGGNVQDEGYVQVNKGSEDRSNRHPGGGSTSSAPQVLYDTARTGNRGAVKGAPVAQYAVVDKSKKKPKKPKPGELQYAELAEFSTGQGGQRSSISPTNRTETQYADVNAM